jgi:hypothetical protein
VVDRKPVLSQVGMRVSARPQARTGFRSRPSAVRVSSESSRVEGQMRRLKSYVPIAMVRASRPVRRVVARWRWVH